MQGTNTSKAKSLPFRFNLITNHLVSMKRKLYKILIYLSILRPYQWVKNLLVFSGLIFSTSLFKTGVFSISLAAFGIFCLASSGIYILNDLRDVKLDMKHPVKRNRAIASGKVSKVTAILTLFLLLLSSIMSAYLLNIRFFSVILIYISLNVAYSFGLKKVVILDAFIVASGFLLRAFAGCIVIHVDVTPWLFICTLSLALLVSFGKRRNELNSLQVEAKNHRETLEYYNIQLLDIILTISSATAIGTYSLYTMADETVLRFGSHRLIMTTPFVMYGVFRYLYLIYTQNKGGDPTKLLVKDFPTILNGILWILSVGYVIYGSKFLLF
jgi:4-hydroxybenzoate polyprenyltransferase